MKQQNGKHKIGLYIRVSTEEQAENPEGSIKNQEERLRLMVKLKNMENDFGEITDVYVDRARSGKDTKRPELQRLLEDIRTQKINLVMSSELSRISRSMRDFSEIWEMMKTNGCGFYSLRENFDTTTAAGEMVLYTLANLAQFERRQISERVAANLNIRASRGLYNGGVVPIGYQLIPDKPGFLEIDEPNAITVRACFKYFLLKESLSATARYLNDNNFKLPRRAQGGGSRPRLSHFTIDNLHHILHNKAYVALKNYRENGKVKDAKALWPPIVEQHIFDSVQKMLSKNLSAKKPETEKRYPYILTGLLTCAKCGSVMVGKSAHGKNEKIGYYEHAWATKRQSCLSKKILTCNPHRVNAVKLHDAVMSKFNALLANKELAKDLLAAATNHFRSNSDRQTHDRLKSLLCGFNSQLEALTERLGQLPKSVSPTLIFKQMEKIEKQRQPVQEQLDQLQRQGMRSDKPAEIKDYSVLLEHLRILSQDKALDSQIQKQLIQRLIKKVEVGVDFIRVHFIVGESSVRMGRQTLTLIENHKSEGLALSASPSKFTNNSACNFSKLSCSNSLTFGRGSWT